MDFQSVLVEIAEAFVAENYRSQLPQGLLMNQGGMAPVPAGSSVSTMHEMTSAVNERQESAENIIGGAGEVDQQQQSASRRSPTEGANSSTGVTGAGAAANHVGATDYRNQSAKQSIQPALVLPRSASEILAAGSELTGQQLTAAVMLHGILQDRPATAAGGEVNANQTPNSKSIPVHCLVEQGCGQATEPTVEMDSYAIIPSSTLFTDLVRTALIRLAYSPNEVLGARGAIQIKNWKPLSFEQITDNGEATVADILGELANIATLRIRLHSRPKPNAALDMKEKLLQVLLAQQPGVLMNSGCPIDQRLLAALTKGRSELEINEDTRKRFDQWYFQNVLHICQRSMIEQQHQQQQQQQAAVQQLQHHLQKQQPKSIASNHQAPEVTYSTTSPPRLVSAPPLSQHRTRIRTSFDPELELPKLQQWFNQNQHPSRVQIQQYVKELNSLESRRGRKPLDINNVVYWFKNARAAHKRQEQRGGVLDGNSNGLRSPYFELAGESHSHIERFDTGNPLLGHHRLVMGSPYGDDHVGVHNPESSTGYDAMDSGDENLEEDDYDHTLDLSIKKQKVEEEEVVIRGGIENEETSNNERRTNPPTPVNNISLDNINKISLDGSNKIVVKQEPQQYSSSEQSMEDSSGVSGDEDNLMDQREDGNSSNDAGRISPPPRRDSPESQPGSEMATPNGNGGEVSPPLFTPTTPTSNASSRGNGGENGLGVCAPVQVNCLEERRKRNRTFIDPVTEVPRLESWFSVNTHPSHSQIVRYTQDLNNMPYRSKFPKLEPKNIQFWFKNRRAKCKRLNIANYPQNGVERFMQNAIRDTENAAALHSLSAAIRETSGANSSSIRGISAAAL